jgi:HTH-type transcriptional regulator / antitoxin HigA
MFGAARWLAPDKALIQLSLYYKGEDQLWFSFFHEAGHILLHGRRDVFVDVKGGPEDQQEAEANEFAASTLIDEAAYRAFVNAGDFSAAAVRLFAKDIGIVPGIVVGRLQHDEYLHYSQLTNLKRRFDWAEGD